VTAKFDISFYLRETSIDSDLIEKCIFINVREYSLFSLAPTNSARCNLRFCAFFVSSFIWRTLRLCFVPKKKIWPLSLSNDWVIS